MSDRGSQLSSFSIGLPQAALFGLTVSQISASLSADLSMQIDINLPRGKTANGNAIALTKLNCNFKKQ